MEFRVSIGRVLKLLAMCALMIAASWFCTTMKDDEGKIIGWIGIVFFGAGTVIIVSRLFRTGVVVLIDEEGIVDHRLSSEKIRWDDVYSVNIAAIKSTKFLCIDVRDADKFRERLSPVKRMMMKANASIGFPGATIALTELTPGIDDAWSYIASLHPEKTGQK